jgi:hypothetical protein
MRILIHYFLILLITMASNAIESIRYPSALFLVE